MTTFIFANNVNTTLAGPVSNSATSFTLSSTANLPASIPAGSVLVLTMNDVATRQNFEIVYATAITGATVSGLLRGQEGTPALAWLTGDFAYSPPTAGQQASFGQVAANNTWTGNDIFNNPVTIPDGISPNHAASVEQLNNRKQIFTSSGSFTVPNGITTMYLSGCAAGGGGGAGGPGSIGASGAWAAGGGGGGAGQPFQRVAFSVTVGGTISVAIGAAGTGGLASGNNPGNNGTSGGNTVIGGSGFNGGTALTLIGGGGGGGGFAVATTGNAVGGAAGAGFPAGGFGNDTTNGNASGSGGTGASGPFGGGGGAARSATSGGVNGGNAFGFGAGGGGAAGVYLAGAGNGGSGGNGAIGYMAFEW